MTPELIELAGDLRETSSLDAFWSRINQEFAKFGVSSIFYGALASRQQYVDNKRTKAVLWKSNHPKEWFELFGKDTFLDGELTAELCVQGHDVVLWHHDHLWQNATPEQKKRCSIERDLGLDVGFSIPLTAISRGIYGGIGVATKDLTSVEFERLWQAHSQTLLGICQMLDVGMRAEHLATMIGLSNRERECLTLLANGLRPGQIADRLGVGPGSINKYIDGGRHKLNATTRDQAVAKALIFGAITP